MAALLKMPASIKVPDFLRNPFRPSYLIAATILLTAALFGLITPLFVSMMDGKLSKLAALPAAMVFGLLLLYDRKLSILLIICLRAGTEKALMLTTFSLGGIPLGIGGLLNGCVIMIAVLLVIEDPRGLPRRAYIAWLPFLLVLMAGVVPSPAKGDAVRLVLQILSYFSVFVAGYYCVNNKEDFRRCIKVVLWSSAIPLLYGVVDTALHLRQYGGEFRVYSTFGHPNILAFYLTVVISLAFYIFKSLPPGTSTSTRLFMMCYLFALLGLLALTKTRSAWVAMAVTFGLYAVFFERRYLLYMAGLGLAALMIPGVLDRLSDLGQGNQVGTYANLNSFSWRLYLWQTGLQWMSATSYVVGNGLQAFKEYSVIFFPFADNINWNAHSVYVQILFELGVFGVLAYAWLYIRVLGTLTKLIKIDRLAAFSLIVVVLNFLICAFSDNMLDYLAYNWYLWFAVGAASALVLHAQASKPDASQ